jgi:hypothetical protein
MPKWFMELSIAWWRSLIVKALATTPATYDPAALDKIIRLR